jgi:gluconolactonase
MEFKTIISGLNFPEGPVFDFNGNLWFVEIKGGNLAKWDGNILERFGVDGTPNGATIDKQGMIWFCDSGMGEIRMFDPVNKSFKTLCNQTDTGIRLKRPNDLIFDNAGNLLFSDHADGREDPVSTICVLPKDKDRAKVISNDKYFTNGLALMRNGTTLIFSETYRQQLWIAEWDAAHRSLKKEGHFAKAGNGPWGPDGIAFDKEENLYVTVFNENRINIYNKEGILVNWLACSDSRPTSCAFDPFGRYGLVVTQAELGEITICPSLGKGLPIFYG